MAGVVVQAPPPPTQAHDYLYSRRHSHYIWLQSSSGRRPRRPKRTRVAFGPCDGMIRIREYFGTVCVIIGAV